MSEHDPGALSPTPGRARRQRRTTSSSSRSPIGPLVTRNRFFQVPHCNGMGYRDPSAEAALRKVKAEGGWAVVCTEQVEIHPTSDITPFIELRIWDDQDLPALARIAAAIHEGGALAGIELCHNGLNAPNLYSRETPLGPHHLPVASYGYDPVQARMMTKQDIADLRRWHRNAVARSMQAGYDLVYVYAGHSFGGIEHFLSPRFNQRTDEYGGSARNRMRLLREILEDTREVADGRAAVACRITRGRGTRRRRPQPRRHRGDPGRARRAARPVGLRAGHLGGRLATPPGSARKASRSSTSPG